MVWMRGMAEQELDLFQFPAPAAAEFGAGAAQVVGPEPQSQLLAVKTAAASTAWGESESPVIWPWRLSERRIRPSVMPAASHHRSTACLTQAGTGDGAQAAVLAAEIDDHPAAVALLDVSDGQGHGFAAAQPAADEQGQQGAIALALEGGGIGAVDESLGLRLGEPVPCPGALLLDARHLVDAGGHFGIEQPVGGGLARQFLDRGQALVDGGGRVALGFEDGAVGLDGGAGEGRTSLLRPPGKKSSSALAYMVRVRGARDGVEHQPLDRHRERRVAR